MIQRFGAKPVYLGNDVAEPSQHAHFDLARFKAELNRLNLDLIASEFSQTEPGYIAGAIDHVNAHALTLMP